MRLPMTVRNVNGALRLLALCWWLVAIPTSAQSLDIASPSAVRTREVTGTIAARDLGDSRLTDHFFAFTGTPGDLLITVESRNLNGDFDVFTLAGMRPLLKFTVYDGSSAAITKSIFLRKREDLILRIEARTPNDDEGTYRVKFGGSFEPIAGASEDGSERTTQVAATGTQSNDVSVASGKSGKTGRRVSSVGARIDEPPSPEVAALPDPEPEPPKKPAREVTAPRARSRNVPVRPPATRRTRPREEAKKEEPPAESEGQKETTAGTAEAEPKTTPGRRRTGRRTPTARAVEKPSPPPEPESGPRLLIETSDGTLIDRFMSTVRRVTVENGQVVVVGKDGKIQRLPLSSVVRMSIAP